MSESKEESKEESTEEIKKESGWTLRIGGPLLVLLCVAWVANQWHVRTLQGELHGLVPQKFEEYRLLGERIGAKVIVSKPYVFFGPPAGKIAVYVEHHQIPDTPPAIHSYYFFFARQADKSWTETESAYCGSAECIAEGRRVFSTMKEAA